jgi:hypothetical protein
LPVVDYRMLNAIADGSLPNTRGLALRDIFSAVDSHDSDFVGILILDLPQLRKDVNTVDSAIGPEIQQYYSSAKLRQRERGAVGVNPVKARWEVRGSNARQI